MPNNKHKKIKTRKKHMIKGLIYIYSKKYGLLIFLIGVFIIVSITSAMMMKNYLQADNGVYKTYYVRTNGGTATQCTGLVDSAYTSGTNQPCAWNNPMIALPSSGTARIAGGDTLIIGNGEYKITSELVIPAGLDTNSKTVIRGKQAQNKPILWGSGGIGNVVNLKNNSFIELSNIEVTDYSSCGREHPNQSIKCASATGNDGIDWASNGINAYDSHDVYIDGAYVHGLAAAGFYTGGIRDWTVENTQIISNSFVGFDLDSVLSNKKNNPELLNSGTLTFNNLKIEWTGCSESYPDKSPQNCTPIGVNADGMGASGIKGIFKFTNTEMSHNLSDGLDLLYSGDVGESTIELDRFKAEGNLGNQVKINANATIKNSVIIGNCNYFQGNPRAYIDVARGHVFDDCRGGDASLVLSHVGGEHVTLINNTIVNMEKNVRRFNNSVASYEFSDGVLISFNPRSYTFNGNTYYHCSDQNDGVEYEYERPDESATFIARNNIFYGGLEDGSRSGRSKILDTNYVDTDTTYGCTDHPVIQYEDGTTNNLSDYNIISGAPGSYGTKYYRENGVIHWENVTYYGVHDQRGLIDVKFNSIPNLFNNVDSDFLYDLQIQSSSPAKNIVSGTRGVDFTAVDYLNNDRPEPGGEKADIGAYEYGSSGGPPVITLLPLSITAYENTDISLSPAVTNATEFSWNKININDPITLSSTSSQSISVASGTPTGKSNGSNGYQLKFTATNGMGNAEKTVTIYIYKRADINGDGTVNSIDFYKLLANWGILTINSDPMADIDDSFDGKVDSKDFYTLLGKWG